MAVRLCLKQVVPSDWRVEMSSTIGVLAYIGLSIRPLDICCGVGGAITREHHQGESGPTRRPMLHKESPESEGLRARR